MSLFDLLGKSSKSLSKVSTTTKTKNAILKKSIQRDIMINSEIVESFKPEIIDSMVIEKEDESEEETSTFLPNPGIIDVAKEASTARTTPAPTEREERQAAQEEADAESEIDPTPISDTTPRFDIIPESDPQGSEGGSASQPLLIDPGTIPSESFSGLYLELLDRPQIIGTLENRVVRGFPAESVVFIKRVNTSKYFEIGYKIYRKAIFYERDFKLVANLEGDKISADEQYTDFIKNDLNLSPKRVITFVDSNLRKNQVYAYKVRVEYRELTEEERKNRSNLDVYKELANIVSSNLFSGLLFNV